MTRTVSRAALIAAMFALLLAACGGEDTHAGEAQSALTEAKPKLEAVRRDENAWSRAGADACSAHADPRACDGVDVYLVKYPAGRHADEASSLTVRSQP
jgi:hypothetical protein